MPVPYRKSDPNHSDASGSVASSTTSKPKQSRATSIPVSSTVTAPPAAKPEVKITNEDPINHQQHRVDHFREIRDNMKEESGPTERQLRNQRFWAGLGDALSGVAGLISAVNGGMAIDTSGKTAIGAVRNAQEEARKRRREKFDRDYTLASDRLKRESDYLAQLRAKKQAEQTAAYAAAKEKREQAAEARAAEAHAQKMELDRQKAERDESYNKYLMGKPYYNPNPSSGGGRSSGGSKKTKQTYGDDEDFD